MIEETQLSTRKKRIFPEQETKIKISQYQQDPPTQFQKIKSVRLSNKQYPQQKSRNNHIFTPKSTFNKSIQEKEQSQHKEEINTNQNLLIKTSPTPISNKNKKTPMIRKNFIIANPEESKNQKKINQVTEQIKPQQNYKQYAFKTILNDHNLFKKCLRYIIKQEDDLHEIKTLRNQINQSLLAYHH